MDRWIKSSKTSSKTKAPTASRGPSIAAKFSPTHSLPTSSISLDLVISPIESSRISPDSGKKNHYVTHAITAFEFLKMISETNDSLAPMKTICDALLNILNTIEAMDKNKEAWMSLVETIRHHRSIFKEQLSSRAQSVSMDPSLQSAIHTYARNLQVILAGVIRESGLSEKNTRGDARMRTLLRSVQRFGTVKLEKDAIDSYIKQLDDTVKLFQTSTGLHTAYALDKMSVTVNEIYRALSPGSPAFVSVSLYQATKWLCVVFIATIFIITIAYKGVRDHQISELLVQSSQTTRIDEQHLDSSISPPGIILSQGSMIGPLLQQSKPRPSVVEPFMGREDILETMRQTHFNRSTHTGNPKVTILSGLGGSGKTQTALKFALEFEIRHSDISVYFVDASSEEKLKAEFETLIRSLGGDHRSSSYHEALTWLAMKQKHWLLILDNADDPSLNIFPYIPKSGHGSVIITTRNSIYTGSTVYNSHYLEGLSTDDATELILIVGGYDKTEANRSTAFGIVKELGCLPLAVMQAGAYILANKCLSTYLDTYRQNRAELFDSRNTHLHQDYPHSVATTIQLSLHQLPIPVQNILRLFSELDTTSIAHEIIEKPAIRQFRWVSWTDDGELMPKTEGHANVLMQLFSPNGEWSPATFDKLISQCTQYSLLRTTIEGDNKFYSMHILVQSYLRGRQVPIEGWSQRHLGFQPYYPRDLVIRLLGSAITPAPNYEHLAFNRLISSHLRLVQMEDVDEPGDHLAFGEVFYELGNMRLSIMYREECIRLWRNTLREEHENTLAAKSHLAVSYKGAGNQTQALKLQEELFEITKKTLAPDDPMLLLTMGNLAAQYSLVGRNQDTMRLLEQVLETQKNILGQEDDYTLMTMENLSISYNALHKSRKALKLQRNVLEIKTKKFGSNHGITLRTMSRLSNTYSALGRHREALELRERVVEMQKCELGIEHLATLQTMAHLGSSYAKFGRHQEALELYRMVIKIQTQKLGREHKNTLLTMSFLLVELLKLGMITEIQEWLSIALPAYEKGLGMDDPSTLWLKKRFRLFIDADGKVLHFSCHSITDPTPLLSLIFRYTPFSSLCIFLCRNGVIS